HKDSNGIKSSASDNLATAFNSVALVGELKTTSLPSSVHIPSIIPSQSLLQSRDEVFKKIKDVGEDVAISSLHLFQGDIDLRLYLFMPPWRSSGMRRKSPNDIMVFSRSEGEHVKNVASVLQILRDNNLFAKASKFVFHASSVEYMVYVISSDGLNMDSSNVKQILNCPQPKNIKALQSFLGFSTFYHYFIKNYSTNINALTTLLNKYSHFIFNEESLSQFQILKEAFTIAPILSHFNPSLPAIVETDACNYSLDAVLSQVNDSGKHPIAFDSHKLLPAEMNYENYDKELLGIVWVLRFWRAFLVLLSNAFEVLTDHSSLQYFMSSKVLTCCQACWAEFPSEFHFTITYFQGRLATLPNALSFWDNMYPERGWTSSARILKILIK
ncbi:hypothetical protein O181_113750, partial [Austropuccinia psidii MF-1]|nr:hypothetical protein [Austropuccinia psidii MF-1]